MVSPLTAFAEKDGAGLPTSTDMVVVSIVFGVVAGCDWAGRSLRCGFPASDFRLK